MLEIKGLKKSFKAKEVLKNLNLSIKEGEIVCLLGNNGAGKTTLINCILRHCPVLSEVVVNRVSVFL